MRKWLIMAMAALMPVAVVAQDVAASAVDSAAVEMPVVGAASVELPTVFALPSFDYSPLPVEVVAPVIAPLEVPPMDLSVRYHFAPGRADLISGGGFRLSATGDAQRMPGLMGVESGGFQASQTISRVTIAVNAQAHKYGFFNGFARQFGVGGSVSWQVNERISLHAFGSYYSTPRMFIPPAVAGFMATSSYGGFASYNGDGWGFDLGAQNVYNPSLRHWEMVPIVRPYIVIGNTPIGVDVGPIIYQLLRNAIGSGSNNPTIGPPTP